MKIEGLYTGTILKCTYINDTLKNDVDESYGFFRYNYEMYKENVLLAKIENGGYVKFDKLNSIINRIKIGKDIHKNGWREGFMMSTCPGNVGDYFIDANSLESYKNDDVIVKKINTLLALLSKSDNNFINGKNINYIITESKDGTLSVVERLQNEDEKIKFSVIKKQEFSHSLSREKVAKNSTADILVFITQDVKIERDDWLEKIATPIANGEVEACYSRQLCENYTLERYTRECNYPSGSVIKTKDDIEKLGLNTFFFSDASSAIKTDIFKKLNGYDGKDFPTNEDMYIAYKLITNGYKIKYCAASEVVHSHKFTLKQQYKRYYDTGKFFKQNEYLNKYKVNKSGSKLAMYVLRRAWQEKNWRVLLNFIPNMTARFIGMKVGKM